METMIQPKVTGYRQLSQAEVALMNDGALTETQREYFLSTARALDDIGLLESDRKADALRAVSL